jgi:hypothetical protein
MSALIGDRAAESGVERPLSDVIVWNAFHVRALGQWPSAQGGVGAEWSADGIADEHGSSGSAEARPQLPQCGARVVDQQNVIHLHDK